MTDLRPLRRRILTVAANAGEGHIPSAYSVLEIIWVLYDKILGPDDRFVLSKGHASLALYAVLEAKGIMPEGMLDQFCNPGGPEGHPNCLITPGVEISSGSLGHGLAQAVGMALAKKIKGESGRIYVLCGDSECEEGSVWEAAHIAAHLKLDNLTLIVDANGTSPNKIDGGDGDDPVTFLGDKFRAFGWDCWAIFGHDQESILGMMTIPNVGSPLFIRARTIKGCGIPAMEESQAWHHKAPNEFELAAFLAQLTDDDSGPSFTDGAESVHYLRRTL